MADIFWIEHQIGSVYQPVGDPLTKTDDQLDTLLQAWSQASSSEKCSDSNTLLQLEHRAISAGNHGLRLLWAPPSEPSQWVLRACAILALDLVDAPLLQVLRTITGWSSSRARCALARHTHTLADRGLIDASDSEPRMPSSMATVLVGGAPGEHTVLTAPDQAIAPLLELLPKVPTDPRSPLALVGSTQTACDLFALKSAARERVAALVEVEIHDPRAASYVWWGWCWGTDLLFAGDPHFAFATQGQLKRLVRYTADTSQVRPVFLAEILSEECLQFGKPSYPMIELPSSSDPKTGPGSRSGRPFAPTISLDELAFSDQVRAQLDTVIAGAREGERQVVLLHGPPGTGKTDAAAAIASALERPLLDLDAARVRGKYYGEEERRMAETFELATHEGAVLRIDELDDWAMRRTHSSDPSSTLHRSVTTMLRCLERYQGVAVLTTNRLQALDPAVFRRIDKSIALDLPDELTRMCLWARYLPESLHQGPTLTILSALPLAGGDIVALLREVGESPSPIALIKAARERAELRRLMGSC